VDEEKVLLVFDLNQFSLSCMDYEVLQMFFNILQYNYPEILSGVLVVNSPMIFIACWQIIKLWIDPTIAAKCVFLQTNQLHTYIDLSEISPDVSGIVREKGSTEALVEGDPIGAINSIVSSNEIPSLDGLTLNETLQIDVSDTGGISTSDIVAEVTVDL
jgi:hypothetical protein